MSSQFKSKFEKLENSRKALFDSLRQYPADVLNKKPSPEAWSIAQVMQHLIISEEFSHNYVQKKAQDTSKAQNAGFRGKRRLFVVNFFFVFPFKFKAPDIVAPPDNTPATLAELETRWTALRSNSYALLSKLSDKELEKELWKHTMAGKMNIYQMLDFTGIHFNKHRKQIERTLGLVKV